MVHGPRHTQLEALHRSHRCHSDHHLVHVRPQVTYHARLPQAQHALAPERSQKGRWAPRKSHRNIRKYHRILLKTLAHQKGTTFRTWSGSHAPAAPIALVEIWALQSRAAPLRPWLKRPNGSGFESGLKRSTKNTKLLYTNISRVSLLAICWKGQGSKHVSYLWNSMK